MLTYVLLVGVLLGAEAEAAPSQNVAPEIWICHRDLHTLLDEEDGWAFVRENVDGVQFYIDRLTQYSRSELEGLAAMLQEADLQVSVECGGTLNFGPMDETNGAWSAEVELRKIQHYTDAGGRIDYLNIDGPVRRLLYPTGDREGFTDYTACAEQLVVYMRAVRDVYPDIRFFLLTNFPNWGYRGDVSYHARGPERQDWGDYHEVLEAVLPVIAEAALPLVGLTIDNPYEYALGTRQSATLEDPTSVDWGARIQDLQAYAREAGLEVNMIINSEDGGGASDAAFHEKTLKFLEWYLEQGAHPNRIFIQSWYDHPKAVLPETAHGSMTALVRDAILHVRAAE